MIFFPPCNVIPKMKHSLLTINIILTPNSASITHSLSEIKDERIGIVAENRIETYAAILAVLAGGKTYVILHPAYPEERNLKIAALAGLRTLLCTSDTDRSAFGTGHFRIIDTDRLPGKALSEQQ